MKFAAEMGMLVTTSQYCNTETTCRFPAIYKTQNTRSIRICHTEQLYLSQKGSRNLVACAQNIQAGYP